LEQGDYFITVFIAHNRRMIMTVNTITLNVIGKRTIHCGGCENNVKIVLRRLPGVQQVEASHKTQKIHLTLDPQTLKMEQIYQQLDLIGYQVTPERDPLTP
jgi:copper chaperone CopZ